MVDILFKSTVGRAERVALCTLRKVVHGEEWWNRASVCPFGIGRDMALVRAQFLDVWGSSAGTYSNCVPRQAGERQRPSGV